MLVLHKSHWQKAYVALAVQLQVKSQYRTLPFPRSLPDRICLPSTAPLRFRYGSGRHLPVGVRRWFPSPCTLPDPGASSSPRSALPRALGPLPRLQHRRRRRQHPPRANPSTERLRGDGGSLRAGLRQVYSAGLPRGTQHGSLGRKSFLRLGSSRWVRVWAVLCIGLVRGCRGRCRPRRCRSWWGGTGRCRSSLTFTRPGAGPVFRWRRTSRWWATLPASFPSFGALRCCVIVDFLANTMPVCEVATNETSDRNEFCVPVSGTFSRNYAMKWKWMWHTAMLSIGSAGLSNYMRSFWQYINTFIGQFSLDQYQTVYYLGGI